MERIEISDNQVLVDRIAVPIKDIAEIYLTQGLREKVNNQGQITLYTFFPLSNGENKVTIKNIKNPDEYYKEIYELIIKNKNIQDLKKKDFSPAYSHIKQEKYSISKIGVEIERNNLKREKFFILSSSIKNIELELNDNDLGKIFSLGTILLSTIGSTLRKVERKEKFRIFKQNRITVFNVSNSPFEAFREIRDGYKICRILKYISTKNASGEQTENKIDTCEKDIVIKPKYIFFNAFYDRLKAFFVSLAVAPITTGIINSPLNPSRGGCGWELILIIVFSSLLGVSGLIFLVTLFLCIALYKTYKNAKYIISENKITTEFFYEKQIEFNKINKISLEQSLIQKKNKLATIYIFKDKKEKLKLIDIENPYKIYQNIKDKINSHKNANKTIGYTISQEINFKSICISIFVALLYALIISLIIILIFVIWATYITLTTKNRVHYP